MAGSRYVLSGQLRCLIVSEIELYYFRRPGALIAGTWAAMQYMGQE